MTKLTFFKSVENKERNYRKRKRRYVKNKKMNIKNHSLSSNKIKFEF